MQNVVRSMSSFEASRDSVIVSDFVESGLLAAPLFDPIAEFPESVTVISLEGRGAVNIQVLNVAQLYK